MLKSLGLSRCSEMRMRIEAACNVLRGNPTMYKMTLSLDKPLILKDGMVLFSNTLSSEKPLFPSLLVRENNV